MYVLFVGCRANKVEEAGTLCRVSFVVVSAGWSATLGREREKRTFRKKTKKLQLRRRGGVTGEIKRQKVRKQKRGPKPSFQLSCGSFWVVGDTYLGVVHECAREL